MFHVLPTRIGMRSALAAGLTVATVLLAATTSALALPDFTAFPDGDADSGRFTNIVNALQSLGEDDQGATGVGGARLVLEIPGSRSEFRLSIFDGDYGTLWDYVRSPAPVVEYLLTPDADADRFPDRDTAGDIIVLGRWTSAQEHSDDKMPDSGWFECTGANSSSETSGLTTGVATHSLALVNVPGHPSQGRYRYIFVVRWADPAISGNAMNCFKVRVQGQIFGPAESRIGIMGFKWGYGEYGGPLPWSFSLSTRPFYTITTPPLTSYDGSWAFFWNLPPLPSGLAYQKLDLWNGDWDAAEDTDDPHSTGVPPWVPSGNTIVQAESSNPGVPTDDAVVYTERDVDGNVVYEELYPLSVPVHGADGKTLYDEDGRRVGILHRIVFPDGFAITELNPSGNREWENFQVAVEGYYTEDPTQTEIDPATGGTRPKRIYPEATVETIPPGAYSWRIEGADEQNTLFLRPDFDLFAEFGQHALGDRIFWDSDGVPSLDDQSEPGINGVKVDLYFEDEAGAWVFYASTVTGTATGPDGEPVDGVYHFDSLASGEWKVVIDIAGSPALAGALAIYDRDGGQDCTTLVGLSANESQHDVDFSFRLTCAPGTGTPGYWKNHPEAWPVTTILIGGTAWSREDAIRRMKKATAGGNKANTMFMHLVAAKLNVLAGNSDAPIRDTIVAADTWMATYDGTSVSGSSAAWREGEPLAQRLDAYNNGLLPGAPSRDVVGSSCGEARSRRSK